MPPRPKPSRPISTEADKLTRRGPGRPPRPPVPGTKAEDPPGGAKPAAPPTPTPPVVIPWAQLAEALKAVTDPAYKGLGVDAPPLKVWEGFCAAWGNVADYYMPALQGTPWPPAIAMSAIVAMPLLAALRKRQGEKAKTEAAAKAAAAAQLSTEQPAA